MKEINVQAVISEVESFNNKIGALKSKEELLKKTILSLKNTTQNIQNNTCPFDQNLGNTLDFIVDFGTKKKIMNGATKGFDKLVASHLKNIKDVNATDKSFMSAKKLLTHIKKLNKCIITTDKEGSSPSKLSNLFKKLKTKLKEKSEAKKQTYTTVLSSYLTVIIDLLKFEKYRLTSKVYVKDSSVSSGTLKVTTQSVPEQCIQHILSDDFKPKESDIHQGAIGDCYLLVALKNIARTDPNIIKNVLLRIRTVVL